MGTPTDGISGIVKSETVPGQGERLTMADGSQWLHPFNGGAPICEIPACGAIHHNADRPGWTPKVAARVYACSECGTEKTITTNHSGTVWAEACAGKCRDISNPHTARERVSWHPPRPHKFVRDA